MKNIRHFILLAFLLQNLSCARSYIVKTDSTKSVVEQVNLIAVEYQRPKYEPAEKYDFKVKNREIDCMHADELWKDLVKNEVKVRECVNSIEEGQGTYFYIPGAQPALELDLEEAKNPNCLKAVLSKIPLPREIYYLGKPESKDSQSKDLDEEDMGCYSSSFATNTNEFMMTKNGYLKKKIVLPFPLDRPLKNARDVSVWLMVTTFSILKSDEKAGGKLLAMPVPESICRSCFKHDALFDDKYTRKLKPVFWP